MEPPNPKDPFLGPLYRAALFLGAFITLLSCAQVPITQRRGLHLIPDSQLIGMSFRQYDQVLREAKLSRDSQKVALVKRVGERVARSAEAFLRDADREQEVGKYTWEFNLIEDDKTVNAWCLPGGKVAVYTGILPYTLDDNGLAVIIGHEVAHALAGHGNERMSQALLVNMGGVALSVALSSRPNQTRQLFMAVYGAGASVGLLLPYSRLHENEADRIGLMLMARAGYDPRAAVAFWQRMNEHGGSRPPEFLSTHPAPESRIESIRAYIPEAMPYYEKSR